MSEVKYSKEHEWIKVEGDVGTIGITQHATEMLGDIVFVELPDVGSSVEKDGKQTEYSAKHIIIATGARSRELPNLPQDGKNIIGYREAMTLKEMPKKIGIRNFILKIVNDG